MSTTAFAHAEHQCYVTNSLVDIKQFEGAGRIINEHYDSACYFKRRHHFLGCHPDYKSIGNLATKARSELEQVFRDATAELSVQEVRRRELECEIDPLTPLPTSDNCDTIDDFASYPDQEWQPNVAQLRRDSQAPPPPPPPSTPALSLRPNIDSRSSNDLSRPSESTTSVSFGDSPPTSPNSTDADSWRFFPEQHGLTDDKDGLVSAVLEQTTNIPQKSVPGQSGTTAIPSSPFGSMADQLINHPTREVLRQVVQALNHTPTAHMSPATYRTINQGFSALAGRPADVPVKTPRGTKRTATDGPDAPDPNDQPTASNVSNVTTSTKPPTKMPRLIINGPKAPRSAPSSPAISSLESTARVRQEPKKTTRKTPVSILGKTVVERASSQLRATRKGKTTTTAKPVSAPDMRIRRIATGEILPQSRDDAVRAQEVRKDTFLAARPELAGHDLPDPEFFETANYKAKERREGAVRCLCGSTRDEHLLGQEWVACDRCHSWQHVRCVGDATALDAQLREAERYDCFACDPFRHRKTLRAHRRRAGF